MTESQPAFNPWLGMLLRPRETIRLIANTTGLGKAIGIIGLIAALGVVETIVRYLRLGTPLSAKYVAAYLLTSLLFVVIAFFLFPPVLRWAG
jgi:hypothetical protein